MDGQSIAILASALTGGLAGAALTIVVNSLISYWRRPILTVVFDNREPGCRVDTNVAGQTGYVRRFIRLKIKNEGRSTAHSVSVCVTELTFTAPGTSRIFKDDVLDLIPAFNYPSPFILAPNAHRYIDLAFVSKDPVTFSYIFRNIPTRLHEQGFGSRAGAYGAKIFVSSENANAAEQVVSWGWDGQFPGLDILN
jgi:hypothetical protein